MKRGLKLGLFLGVVLISLWCVSSVSATDYYVNATTGNDSLAGTSPAAAWKTISEINGRGFSPGDNIYFERGQTWREKLMVSSSGSSGSPITFGAYGSGNAPKLLGSNTKNNTGDWTDEGANIWYASSTIRIEKIVFDGESSQSTRVANKIDLDTQGETWWDAGNGRIYLYSTSNPATFYNGDVECCRYQAIIQAIDKSYLVFQDLDLLYSSADGFYCNKVAGSPTDIIIDGCTVKHTGNSLSEWSGSGIHIVEVDNATVQNCTISYTCDGIYLVYDSSGKTVIVHNNTVSYTINGPHPAGIAFGSNNADPIEFSNSKVSYNDVSYFNGKGITLSHASYMTVEYNIVHDGDVNPEGYCIGIHSGAENQHNNVIRYNIVHTLAGAAGEWAGSVGIGTRFSHHDKIYYNIVYDLKKGIVVDPLKSYGQGGYQEIYNNVGNCSQYGIRVHNGIDADNKFYMTIQNNIFSGTTDDFYVNDYVVINGGYNCLVNDASVGVGTGSTYTNTNNSDLYETDPLFVNASNNDFHLQASSPCIDVGIDVGLTQDYAGISVPLGSGPDIGAYEYDAVAPTIIFSCFPTSVTTGETITCLCSATDSGDSSPSVSYTINPLTSSIGTYITTCTALDDFGNSASSNISYTVSSTGDGGGTVTPTIQETYSGLNIIPGVTTRMKDFDSEFGIKQIQIEVNNEAQNVKITVKKYDDKPANVSVEKSGKVYKYLEIETENLEDKLNISVITIQVEKNWTSENNVEKENMSMFKFNESYELWNELETVYTEENETYYYYDIELDSFSYFAIAEKVVEEPDVGEEVGIREKIREIMKSYWFWVVVALVIIMIIIILIIRYKKMHYLGSNYKTTKSYT